MTAKADPLARFVEAQDPIYRNVVAELASGRKQSHWMWFIFPQLSGLGASIMAQRYAIGSRAEAEAYLDHPVLGPRLIACTRLILDTTGKSIHDILGTPDDIKFRSSMTLFDAVSSNPIFGEAITRYYAGRKDQATLDILARFAALPGPGGDGETAPGS